MNIPSKHTGSQFDNFGNKVEAKRVVAAVEFTKPDSAKRLLTEYLDVLEGLHRGVKEAVRKEQDIINRLKRVGVSINTVRTADIEAAVRGSIPRAAYEVETWRKMIYEDLKKESQMQRGPRR